MSYVVVKRPRRKRRTTKKKGGKININAILKGLSAANKIAKTIKPASYALKTIHSVPGARTRISKHALGNLLLKGLEFGSYHGYGKKPRRKRRTRKGGMIPFGAILSGLSTANTIAKTIKPVSFANSIINAIPGARGKLSGNSFGNLLLKGVNFGMKQGYGRRRAPMRRGGYILV